MAIKKVKRASLEELKEFANKVREAGGGNPIDALMPAAPTDPSQCLIAKNLNFNCIVTTISTGANQYGPHYRWAMVLADRDTRDRIAKALNLKTKDGVGQEDDDGVTIDYAVLLPREIGQVACDFDHAGDLLWKLDYYNQHGLTDPPDLKFSDVELPLVREMWPYIEESVKEAYDISTAVNSKGELIL